MRQIVKGGEPPFFKSWKRKNPHCTSWNDFSKTETYEKLRQHLIKEQTFLCCYCEIALRANTDAHIEHFKPKANPKYSVEMFNFQNLFACCQHRDSCGHKKDSSYFDKLISPVDKNCQSCFTYTGNGMIIPSDENDANANKTIEILGLNCKRLRDRRQSIIKALDNDGITIDHLKESIDNCIEWYSGFFTVIQYVAGKQGLKL